MNPILLVSSCAVLSGVTSLLVSWTVGAAAPTAPIETIERDSSLQDAVAALRADIEALRSSASLAAVTSTRTPAAAPGGSGAAPADIEAIVRSLVSQDALVVPEGELLWPGGLASAALTVQAILDAGVDSDEATDLWQEAAENGQLHALLAEMERHMEDVPESADKHFDRARSYYSAARALPGNNDGNWWVDSNDAYTKALEYDPQHWDARYQKAMNMSFWPTAYGGQAEAIQHFEILAKQQEAGSPDPKFSKTYVFLGNLYAQQGKTEAARAAWEQGLAAFPGNAWLLERLASLGQ